MLQLLLPGTPVVYNGDELGMEDTFIRWDQTLDLYGRAAGPLLYQNRSRDPERTPYQWDHTRHAGKHIPYHASSSIKREEEIRKSRLYFYFFIFLQGFTEGDHSWLPVNPNYWILNVEEELRTSTSHLKIFKLLAALRKNVVFQRGSAQIHILSDWVLSITRY